MTTLLTDIERRDRLRLIRSENVGPITFYRLIEQFGTATSALQALPDLSRRGGRRKTIGIYPSASAEREMESLAALNARLVAWGEPDYPPLLAHIENAPPLLSVLGESDVFARKTMAIVGTRNASANGLRLAERLAKDLGDAGVMVVSGLARGIDTAAHRSALATGTAAVLAGGIDIVYPEENEGLYRQIAEKGVLVSEMPPGTRPRSQHFPRRNRLISGMALGVVVVEAAVRSGSLITARLALDQGREVFAVPGSPLDPRARGPNSLIRQGAVLTETVEDILGALNMPGMAGFLRDPPPPETRPEPAPESDADLDSARATIARVLSPAPATVDEIIRYCQLSPSVVTMVLLEWELAGRLERQPGNRVSLIAGA